MPDFSKTIIYKIVHKDDPDNYECYVGYSTYFSNRKSCHKVACNNSNSSKYNMNLYQYIRENGGWDNFIMLEIEKYPCNDDKEARSKERVWFDKIKPKLNFETPNRNKKEYHSEWVIKNRDYLNEKRTNNKITCDNCGSIVRKDGLSEHKKTKKCTEAKK